MVIKKRETIRAAHQHLKTFAREMRHAPTEAEDLLWSRLRNRALGGFKFKRQYPIGNYIADFICIETRLIVELDGGIHSERIEYDEARKRFLTSEGYRLLRFRNSEVTANLNDVESVILNALRAAAPSPSIPLPLPGARDFKARLYETVPG